MLILLAKKFVDIIKKASVIIASKTVSDRINLIKRIVSLKTLSIDNMQTEHPLARIIHFKY